LEPISTSRAPRVAWVDYAKGICIFFVVMLHTTHHVQDHMGGEGWLQHVVNFAKPFRMPDFFLIAGLFLSNVINRPWMTYLDKKVVHFLYFYAVWATIYFFLFDMRYAFHDTPDNMQAMWMSYLMIYINPDLPLWFIHSLPIYFVLVRLTRWISPWIIWGAAAILQSSDIYTGWVVVDQFCLRFVYFYTGYILAPHVFRIAEWAFDRPLGAAIYLLIWAIAEEMFVMLGISTLPGISLALGYIGALAVIFSACLFCRTRWMEWLRYLGENSIVVYLGFLAPLAVITLVLPRYISDIGTVSLLATLGSAGGAVVMYWLARNSIIGFLYTRPSWLKLRTPAPAPALQTKAEL
jgi:uncharacterized membrane protein YcfT